MRLGLPSLAVLILTAARVLAADPPDPIPETSGWRRLLSFDMTRAATRKADIGNHALLLAEGGATGWELEVRRYPLAPNTENLLYDGNNWHGLQDWMLLPHLVTNNPDVRQVTYNQGHSQLLIVARGCQTTHTPDHQVVFSRGTLEIFHKP